MNFLSLALCGSNRPVKLKSQFQISSTLQPEVIIMYLVNGHRVIRYRELKPLEDQRNNNILDFCNTFLHKKIHFPRLPIVFFLSLSQE